MKATVQTFLTPTLAEKSWPGVLAELFKVRLTFLVLMTTLVGFYMGGQGMLDWALMIPALTGTGLLACGASALNQWMERAFDARMRRTESRPLPSGRMQPDTVMLLGAACCLAGITYLAIAVNVLTSVIGVLTVTIYLLIYTPLKRRTWLNTLVGAVPGALPPLMGWTAARNEITLEGLMLFAILFFWQIPHFLAIAWIYRDDYARAGFQMLPLVDPHGSRTGRQTSLHTLALVGASLLPVTLGLAGTGYLLGALALGGVFAFVAMDFARQRSLRSARRLFLASILYLPLLLALMVGDKIKPG